MSQNATQVSVVMPCSNSIMDETRNSFSIKNLYNLNCKESPNFSYIEQIRTWRSQKSCDWPDTLEYMELYKIHGNLKKNDFLEVWFMSKLL
jgi:hypothetical protein